ncbi:MAG: hypothetical protein V4719_25545 [Planctomycetota bacterium]
MREAINSIGVARLGAWPWLPIWEDRLIEDTDNLVRDFWTWQNEDHFNVIIELLGAARSGDPKWAGETLALDPLISQDVLKWLDRLSSSKLGHAAVLDELSQSMDRLGWFFTTLNSYVTSYVLFVASPQNAWMIEKIRHAMIQLGAPTRSFEKVDGAWQWCITESDEQFIVEHWQW